MIFDGEMVLVQKGNFEMGSGDIDADDSEKPRHEVRVNDFYIDKYMVTNKQFAEFSEDTNYLTTKGTASVGSFPEGASFYGCMDMAGNAWEWCIDAMVVNLR